VSLEITHNPMPMSSSFPIIRMRWRHLLFAHWPVLDTAALRALVPAELEIDTFDGRAWVGLVPFTMEDFSPRVLPPVPGGLRAGMRKVTDFHECNVRTYVYPRGRSDDPAARGVWFFSLDAASRLAVWGARRFFCVPYFNARMHLHRDGDVIDYCVERLALHPHPFPLAPQPSVAAPTLNCRWRALEALPPSQPGDIAHFLTERYFLYAMRGGALHRGRIAHPPWPLRRAELLSLDDSLVQAAGVEIDHARGPLLHHADALDVRAWWLERVSGRIAPRGASPAVR
jgi:uncharacterized protein YqjF (DUF2071 family)